MKDNESWIITGPDGRQWRGVSPLRACAAAQRDTIDPVLAMQRIGAAVAEEQALHDAELTAAYAEGRADQLHDDAEKLYPEHDHMDLGDYYLRHVNAMTGEGLHAKSDIAAQLAWRDREIDLLRTAPVGQTQALFEAIKHGDQKHQDWLRAAILAFYDGEPIPAVVPAAFAAAPVPAVTAPQEPAGYLYQHDETGRTAFRFPEDPRIVDRRWHEFPLYQHPAPAVMVVPTEPVRGALVDLVKIIDAAGLINLRNGVQLGPTVWYVKACDCMDAARAALASPMDLRADAARLDWLERQHVEVRTPLRYGSRHNFHAYASPDLEEEEKASNLRARIDAAMAPPSVDTETP